MTNIVEEHPSVISKKYTLSMHDRCDQCNAQALVKIKGINGELIFCSHHYEKIMNNPLSYQKILQFGIEFFDEREKLTKTR